MLRFHTFFPALLRLVPGVALACLLEAVALRAQQLPAEAIVAPVVSIGAVSDAERAIIFNSMQEHLSARFRVVSQETYQAAEERAFQELDLEQCTAEQCIRKIQDLLQVERFFVLQLIREGGFTQLSLTLVRLEGKTVKNDTCSACDIRQLNEKVAGLVAKVLGEAPRPEVAAPAAKAGRIGETGPAVGKIDGKPTWALYTGIASIVVGLIWETNVEPMQRQAANARLAGDDERADSLERDAENMVENVRFLQGAGLLLVGYYFLSGEIGNFSSKALTQTGIGAGGATVSDASDPSSSRPLLTLVPGPGGVALSISWGF